MSKASFTAVAKHTVLLVGIAFGGLAEYAIDVGDLFLGQPRSKVTDTECEVFHRGKVNDNLGNGLLGDNVCVSRIGAVFTHKRKFLALIHLVR